MSVRIMVGEVGDLLVGIYEAEDRINGYGSIAN